MKLSLFLIIQILLLRLACTKTVEAYATIQNLNNLKWHYMTKFSFFLGVGDYSFQAKFRTPILNYVTQEKAKLNFFIYQDEDYQELHKNPTCDNLIKLATRQEEVNVPAHGEWSVVNLGIVRQMDRTKVWYFVLADCFNDLNKYKLIYNAIDYQLVLKNSNGSHFSEEDSGIVWLLGVYLILLILFLTRNSVKFYRFWTQEEKVDYPFLCVNIGLFLETLAILVEFLHLLVYSFNGNGIALFDFMNQCFSVFSQYLFCCLLVMVASGWSVDFVDFEDMDVYMPTMALVGLLHVMVIGLGRLTGDEQSKFHDYDNLAGRVVILLRIVFAAVFLFFLNKSWQRSRDRGKRTFLVQLGILGGMYLFGFPIIVWMSNMVEGYNRHKFVTIGFLGIQLVSGILLTLLFTSKKGKYYELTYKGISVLPQENRWD